MKAAGLGCLCSSGHVAIICWRPEHRNTPPRTEEACLSMFSDSLILCCNIRCGQPVSELRALNKVVLVSGTNAGARDPVCLCVAPHPHASCEDSHSEWVRGSVFREASGRPLVLYLQSTEGQKRQPAEHAVPLAQRK